MTESHTKFYTQIRCEKSGILSFLKVEDGNGEASWIVLQNNVKK